MRRLAVFFLMFGVFGCGGQPERSDVGGTGGAEEAGGDGGSNGGSGGAGGRGGAGGSPAKADAAPLDGPGGGGRSGAGPDAAADLVVPSDAATVADDAAVAPVTDGGATSYPGMVRIFDGKTWEGWEYDRRCWTIVDGAMHGKSPSGQSQAFTKESYSNFRLILKSKMVKTMDHLGVCLWGDRPAAGSYGFGGCLLMIPPSGSFWDYRNGTDHARPGNEAIKYMFHETEVLANRTTGRILVAVNGKLVHDFKDPNLSRRKHGPIGMQIHKAGDTEVEYKDIEIEVDPKDDKLITLRP
jgi:hypothetical protein